MEEEEEEGFKAKAVNEVEDEEETRGGQVRHARDGALRGRRNRQFELHSGLFQIQMFILSPGSLDATTTRLRNADRLRCR